MNLDKTAIFIVELPRPVVMLLGQLLHIYGAEHETPLTKQALDILVEQADAHRKPELHYVFPSGLQAPRSARLSPAVMHKPIPPYWPQGSI